MHIPSVAFQNLISKPKGKLVEMVEGIFGMFSGPSNMSDN